MQPTPSLVWGLPFAGLLASIAVLPMLAPRFWHRRMGVVTASWTLALLGPMVAMGGFEAAGHMVLHAVLLEYLPFVTLLLALFTAGGGILIEGGPWGRPAGNTALLAIGIALAGVMGTTGVAMVLIHPLLRANAHRRQKVHLVVFFIVLVANAGGATSPLGDPPLYLGFLQGVPFLWPLRHLAGPLVVLAGPLLAAFYVIDRRLEGAVRAPAARALRVRGGANVGLVGVVVAAVVAQGVWHPGELAFAGLEIGWERVAGMAVFAAVAAVSLRMTPGAVREGNLFSWGPMLEVGVLFGGIFVTIVPVLDVLAESGLRPGGPAAYFWLTGVLSAFLDNAPTYLIFFRMAGGEAAVLTGADARLLEAISAGAVFFGALTYIGNAPNMMVRAIAAHRGIRMPGFFGYMMWTSAILLPVFALQTLLFFL
jgi:Na+/H+ antiporter NhaD/arsenite permease-like protein